MSRSAQPVDGAGRGSRVLAIAGAGAAWSGCGGGRRERGASTTPSRRSTQAVRGRRRARAQELRDDGRRCRSRPPRDGDGDAAREALERGGRRRPATTGERGARRGPGAGRSGARGQPATEAGLVISISRRSPPAWRSSTRRAIATPSGSGASPGDLRPLDEGDRVGGQVVVEQRPAPRARGRRAGRGRGARRARRAQVAPADRERRRDDRAADARAPGRRRGPGSSCRCRARR